MSNFNFYRGRIQSCPNYGPIAGDAILNVILSCARHDKTLTVDEFTGIIEMCTVCHKKLMEENYNEGWK